MTRRTPDEFTEHALERLSCVARVTRRRMFGGVGLYWDGVFCALIAKGRLYFKVDESNRAEFERAGMDAFQPFTDRPSVLSYFELPERVLASDSLLRSWLEKALDVARRAAKKKPMRKRTGAHAALGKLDNLGPKSSEWLAEVGVKTRADLERLGSVRAFELVRAAGRKPSMNLLWAREATLLGARWDRLSDEVKRELRARAGLAPPKCKG